MVGAGGSIKGWGVGGREDVNFRDKSDTRRVSGTWHVSDAWQILGTWQVVNFGVTMVNPICCLFFVYFSVFRC